MKKRHTTVSKEQITVLAAEGKRRVARLLFLFLYAGLGSLNR